MPIPDTFIWHSAARLWAGTGEIQRPDLAPKRGFRTISALPTDAALRNLASAICAQDPFCITPQPPLARMNVAAKHFVTLTGGTSGQPKSILRSQTSWCASFVKNARLFEYTTSDTMTVLGALSHSLALYGVLEGLHLGLDIHVLDRMKPSQQRQRIAETATSILYVTPTQLRLLSVGHDTRRLPDVRLILCGGGALDVDTRSSAAKLCPNADIHVFYGAAETSFVTLSDASTPPGSVGVPYPDVALRIKDPVGPDQVGEVWVKSPYLFERYADATLQTATTLDGFVSVGELGHLDEAGNLWLKGRKTRLVQIADQSVFPEEVETFIQRHVSICAVVPVPDPLRGTQLVAVIEGREDTALATDIRASCIDRFGPLIAPKRIIFRPALPHLASGKTDLPTLTQWVETSA